jgi:Golgi phosphoprotein 3
MASTSGLTRRRGAGASSNGNAGNHDDDEAHGRVASPSGPRSPLEGSGTLPVPSPGAGGGGPETSYESGSNGHKIVFDPRDLRESAERVKQPKLTLMEEVLLMGLKDKQGYLSFWNDNISYALRGCIVMELAFRGRIRMQRFMGQRAPPLRDRLIEVVDETLTGEVLLDEALKMMKSSEKMCAADWIDLMSGEPVARVPLTC